MIYSYDIDRDLVKTVLFLGLFSLALIFLVPHNADAVTITAAPQKSNFGPNDWIRVDLSINGYLGGVVNWVAHRPDNSTFSGSLENLRDGKITHQIKRSAFDNDFGNWKVNYIYNGVNQTASFVVEPVIVSVVLDKGLYYDGDIMKINLTTSYYIPIATRAEYYHLNFYDKKGSLVNDIDRIDIGAFEPSITYGFPIDTLVQDNPIGKYKIKVQYYNVFVEIPFEVGDIEKRTTISVKTDKSLYHVGDNVDMNIIFSKVREAQALLEITDPAGNTTTTKFPVTAVATKLRVGEVAKMSGTYRFEIHYAGISQPGSFIVESDEFTPNSKIVLDLSLDKSSYRPGEIINASIHTNVIKDSVSFWFKNPAGKQVSKISIPVESIDMSIPHKINKNDMLGIWKMYVDYGGTIKYSIFTVGGEPIDDTGVDISNVGTPPTLLMTLGSGDIKFKNPRGITTDSSDNVYIVDSGNSEIKKFDSTGKFLLSWGASGNENGKFKNPTGIFTDKKYVYVADTGNARIQKFDKNGNFVYAWGSFGDGPGMFRTPVSLAADNSGDLYVSDSGTDKILVFDSNGQYKDDIRSPITTSTKFSSSNFITFDSKNNFYIVISNDNRILQYSSIGTFIKSFGTMGDRRGELNTPGSVAIDSGGNLYVADTKNYRIQKFDSQGNFLSSWGSLGIGPGQFKEPVGIAIDSKDNVYVVDKANNIVQKFALHKSDEIVIPDWIRNNAKWWSQGVISDSDFAGGIQYMIKQKIIHIPKGGSVIANSEFFIPSWIKTSAGWWSDKKISDTSFANGIQYLISIGIIKI
jgi:hypothetical protein